MSRWRRQQRRRARRARATEEQSAWARAAELSALVALAEFEREHPVKARRWIQEHGRDRRRAALALQARGPA